MRYHQKKSPTLTDIEAKAGRFYAERGRPDLFAHAHSVAEVALDAKMLEPNRFTGKPDEPNDMLARLIYSHAIDNRRLTGQGLSVIGNLMVPGLEVEHLTFCDLRRLDELPEINVVRYAELLRTPRVALPAMIADFGTLHHQSTLEVSTYTGKTDIFYRHRGEWEEARRHRADKGIRIYAPFAEMCGWHELRNIILENSYKDLNPGFYQMIVDTLRAYSVPLRNTQEFIGAALDEFRREAAARGLKAEIKMRKNKSIGGTLEKLDRRKDLQGDVTNLHDLVAFTIIAPDETSAYLAYSLFKDIFNRRGGRDLFYLHEDDYMANPKLNGYRSLNVDIVSLNPAVYANAEAIARSQEMHAEAEGGAYAHQVYKGYGTLHGRQNLSAYVRLIKALSDPVAFEKLAIPATGTTVKCIVKVAKTDGKIKPIQIDLFSDDTIFDVVAMALRTLEEREGIPIDPTRVGIISAGLKTELGRSLGQREVFELSLTLDSCSPMVSGKDAARLIKPVRTVEGALLATKLSHMK